MNLLIPIFNAIFRLYKIFFFAFCILLYILMSTLNIIKAIKKISVNHLRDFIFENYYKQIGFSEEDSYYLMKHLKRKDLLVLANKLIRKVPDPCNTKEHCESFLRKKNKASVRQSAIITYQSKMLTPLI